MVTSDTDIETNSIPLLVRLNDKRFIYDYSYKSIYLTVMLISIVYLICGIVFLSLDKNAIILCPESHILFYIITYLCLFAASNMYLDSFIHSSPNQNCRKYTGLLIPLCFLHVVIIGWGILEMSIIPDNINNDTSIPYTFINNTSCYDLKKTSSWEFANATLYISIISFIIYIICIFYILAQSTHPP